MKLRELLWEHVDEMWFYVILSSSRNIIYFGYHPERMRKTFLERKVSEYEEIQKNDIKELEVVIEINC